VLQAGGADLRGEIRGALREIGLPQIQQDMSELREDVWGMRRDLQRLSMGSARTSEDGRSMLRSAPPGMLDATLLPRDTLSHNDSSHLAHRGRTPSSRRSTCEVSSLRVFASSSAAVVQSEDITESEDENRAGTAKVQDETFQARPPAPVAAVRPRTPWDPEPSLPSTPPSHPLAPSKAQARQSSSDAEQDRASLKKPASWVQDPPGAASIAAARDSSGGQASEDGASSRGRRTQERSADFQERSSGAVKFQTATTANLDDLTGTRKGGQSLANLRISRAVRKARNTRKTTMLELTRSMFNAETYQNLSGAAILSSARFDNAISLLILGNALTIGMEADYAARNVTEAVPWIYRAFELFFCVIFTTELVLRVYVFKLAFFWKRDLGLLWNYFDLLVVGAQLIQEIIELMKFSSDDNNAGHLRLLRILRVLRIVRIFRLVRVLHLISELRTIVSSIIGSFRSLFWVVILLLLMMYIVGVWFLQSVTDHFIARLESDTDGEGITYSPGEMSLKEHFDSLASTILSLWQALSGGVDWSDVGDPLMNEIDWFLGLAFAAFIAFSLLALMNVVTGVFVQTALHSAEREEENFLTDQIIALFHKCKSDGNWGCISEQDLDDRLADPDMAKEWKNINVTADEAKYVFALLDVDESGEVQFEEFLSACLRLRGNAKSLDMLIQLQESRHNTKVLEELFERLEDSVAGISASLQLLQSERCKSPQEPRSSSADAPGPRHSSRSGPTLSPGA